MLLSLVVPCFNEEKSIILFFDEIYNVLNELDMDWEIIFVNDGSRDNTLAIIKDLSNKFKSIKYISFSIYLRCILEQDPHVHIAYE